MAFLTGTTRGGKNWTPTFAESVDQEKCIGCGRCYKACSRKVLEPKDHYDDETDTYHMVMSIAHPENCIGCAGCAVACPKKCYSYITVEV